MTQQFKTNVGCLKKKIENDSIPTLELVHKNG
jgi:hypothetical protein